MIGSVMAVQVTADYTEPQRPQLHFTARTGWINDPNGLVYFKGKYHLFFQHNPFGTAWGNMTWGHAVSSDLLHWRQQPDAIVPDGLGTIFSGSAVVDSRNTSGFGRGSLVCVYTAAGGTNPESEGKPFTQCLAASSDGESFAKYSENPVIPHIEGTNRDPKVSWYRPLSQWVMALYLDQDRYAILTSKDLKHWSTTSTIGMEGASECPDLFPLHLDDDSHNAKWVFWAANGAYRVGTFDGREFHSETGVLHSMFGNTGYAAQTFFNDPKGRRVQIAWLNGSDFKDQAWNQQMGIPTELTLRSTREGPRLCFRPISELSSLRRRSILPSNGDYACESGLFDAVAQIDFGRGGSMTFSVNGTPVVLDLDRRTIQVLGKLAALPDGNTLDVRFVADRASLEIFAGRGLLYMPFFVAPGSGATGISVQYSGAAKKPKLRVYELESVWR